MSDYLTNLAMRAISPVPAVRPLVRTAYESSAMDETVWSAPASSQMTADDSFQQVKSSPDSPQVFRENHTEESPFTAIISESVVQTPIQKASPVIAISIPEPPEMPPHEVLRHIASVDPAESLLRPQPPAARKPDLAINHPQEKVSHVQPEVLVVVPPILGPASVLAAPIQNLSPAKEQPASSQITMSHSSTELILGTVTPQKISRPKPVLFPKISTHVLSQFRSQTTALRPEKSPTPPAAAPTPPPAPEVKITIGRVEIRATPLAVQAPATSSSAAPHLSLETYLRRSASRSA
jgi:hypothetical protein